MDFIQHILDFYYTKKAWLAGGIAAVMAVVEAIQIAVADKAITFDEANGIWILFVNAVGVIAAMVGVYYGKNKPSPTS